MPYWLRRGHIYSRPLQQFDAVIGRTRVQELQVALDSRFPLVQDLLHQGRGGRNAGRILVNVKAAIEVRNTRPFDIDQVINYHLGSIILLVESTVHGTECISSQWLTLFCMAVYLLLKLCKHCLAEEGPPEVFQRLVENCQLHSAVRGCLEQVLGQQTLVEC